MEIDRELQDETSVAADYNNPTMIYQARGQLEEAEKWLRKALTLTEPKGLSATLEGLKSNLEYLQSSRPPCPDRVRPLALGVRGGGKQ